MFENENDQEKECRICQDTSQNEFISPCSCIGTMKYVHKECLNHWRRVCTNPRHITHCDLCGSEYTTNVFYNNNQIKYANYCAIISTLKLALKGLGSIIGTTYLVGAYNVWALKPSIYLMKEGLLGVGISFFAINVVCLACMLDRRFETQLNRRPLEERSLLRDVLVGRPTTIFDYLSGTRPKSLLEVVSEIISNKKDSNDSKVETETKSKTKPKNKPKTETENEHTVNFLILASLGLVSLMCCSTYYLYQNFNLVKRRALLENN